MTSPGGESIGYAELLRTNRDFRFLWLGQIVSLLGDWFNLIASAALIAQLTDSGLAIGTLFVVRMLAPFLVSPLAGVVADRYDRRRILVLTDLARAVTVLGFLTVRTPEQVWLLYSLTAVQLGLSGFFFPARNAILPDIVAPEALGAANVVSSATWSVMLATGAALGGLVAGTWGNQAAFALDSVTFFGSALLIARIRRPAPAAKTPAPATPQPAGGSMLRDYLAGLGYLARHVPILLVALHKGTNALLVTSAMQVIQVTIAERIFVIGEGGSVGLGLMYAVAGVGTGLGPVVARRFTGDRDRALGWALALGYLLSFAGLLAMASLESFGVVLGGVLLRGTGGGIVWVFSTQLLLQQVPGSVRGRVFATEFALFSLMSAVGATLAGASLDAGLSVAGAIYRLAGLVLIPAVLWSAWQLSRRPAEAESGR